LEAPYSAAQCFLGQWHEDYLQVKPFLLQGIVVEDSP